MGPSTVAHHQFINHSIAKPPWSLTIDQGDGCEAGSSGPQGTTEPKPRWRVVGAPPSLKSLPLERVAGFFMLHQMCFPVRGCLAERVCRRSEAGIIEQRDATKASKPHRHGWIAEGIGNLPPEAFEVLTPKPSCVDRPNDSVAKAAEPVPKLDCTPRLIEDGGGGKVVVPKTIQNEGTTWPQARENGFWSSEPVPSG